jgi:creatinine amidohydrolase/Fe(II)-dependent formamide hydrolase-like protein
MRYELMLPRQIRTAIAQNWPVVLPLGVLEYHGEHMAVGMDTLAVVKMLELLEKEIDLVILPPFHYGAASYAVEPPEGNGSVQVGGAELAPFAEALFFSLLRIGFRNIHAIIHHQTENFAAGMPTDLAFKSAGRQASSASSRRRAARAGGATSRWRTTMRSTRPAAIRSTGSRSTR